MSTQVIKQPPYPLYERVETEELDMEAVRKTDDEMRDLVTLVSEPTIGAKEWFFAIWTVCSFAVVVALLLGSVLRLGFGVRCFDWLMHPAVLVPMAISSIALNHYFMRE